MRNHIPALALSMLLSINLVFALPYGIPVDGKQGYMNSPQKVEDAANAGDPRAQFILAREFQTGEGRPKNQNLSIFWYRKSADAGYAPSQNNLGVCYKIGTGVSQDYAKAAEYFKKAADQGDSVAQLHLATLYNIGRGVPQDYSNAIYWYKKSSDQGDVDAQYGLGVIYFYGHGLKRDFVKSYAYFTLAKDKRQDSLDYLQKLQQAMSPKQIKTGTLLADKLERKIHDHQLKNRDRKYRR
jgi:uncharacterized protein